MPEATYEVTGVDCGHCGSEIVEWVSGIEGVQTASVDRTVTPARLFVASATEIDRSLLTAALQEAGGPSKFVLGEAV